HFTLSGPGTVTAGVAANYTLRALDANNNVVTGYLGTVHFTSPNNVPGTGSDPQAVLPADYTFTAGDAGVHIFPVTFKTASSPARALAATDTVNASVTTVPVIGVIVNPADAASFAVVASPTTQTANAQYSFTVTAKDPFGNTTTTGFVNSITFTSND